MYTEGEVVIAKCTKCGETFPNFIFVGDTDMVTHSCIALTGQDKSLILTMWQPNEKRKDVEKRIGSNFKIAKVKYEKKPPLEKGTSFQSFLKTYKPPKATYSCIYCNSDSEVIKTETKEEFLSYGKIEVVNAQLTRQSRPFATALWDFLKAALSLRF